MARVKNVDEAIMPDVQYGKHENRKHGFEHPWEGIGQSIEGKPQEAWAGIAGLDWQLEKQHAFYGPSDGSKCVRIPNRRIWVKAGTQRVFAQCGIHWEPLQNDKMLEFVGQYSKAGGIVPEVAGTLKDERIPFVLARINKDIEPAKGDKLRSYLLFSFPHIVGQAIRIRTYSLRLLCENGMFSTTRATEYSQSHIGEFDFEAAKERVNQAHKELEEAEKRYRVIMKLKLSIDEAISQVLVPVFAPNLLKGDKAKNDLSNPEVHGKKIEAIVQSIREGAGATPGTGWGVLNGVTHWADHVAGKTKPTRLFNSLMGDNSRKKAQVEKRLLELA
jgi:phage/plasmid-like protein (TIGR03299 family)